MNQITQYKLNERIIFFKSINKTLRKSVRHFVSEFFSLADLNIKEALLQNRNAKTTIDLYPNQTRKMYKVNFEM